MSAKNPIICPTCGDEFAYCQHPWPTTEPNPPEFYRYRIFDQISEERHFQDAKWGDQSGSFDGTGPDALVMHEFGRTAKPITRITAMEFAQRLTNQTDVEARHGGASMASILLEEVFEAMAEGGVVKLRAELVQVAAVTVAWLEYLDRRGANPRPIEIPEYEVRDNVIVKVEPMNPEEDFR